MVIENIGEYVCIPPFSYSYRRSNGYTHIAETEPHYPLSGNLILLFGFRLNDLGNHIIRVIIVQRCNELAHKSMCQFNIVSVLRLQVNITLPV